MSEPVIVMPEHQNLEPDVLAIGREMLPPGFRLDVVASADLPRALAAADYLMGFIGPLSDEVLRGARRLKLVQLLSVGYDNFNLEAARAARGPQRPGTGVAGLRRPRPRSVRCVAGHRGRSGRGCPPARPGRA